MAEASRANVGDVSAGDMTQAGLAAKVRSAELCSAEMRSAEMRSAEMTATTEVATATVAAATAACKGVGRETQPAKCDAHQEHSCHFGYHDFSPDIGPRVCTRRIVHPNLGLCVDAI